MLANALCVIWCGRVFFFSGIGCGLLVGFRWSVGVLL